MRLHFIPVIEDFSAHLLPQFAFKPIHAVVIRVLFVVQRWSHFYCVYNGRSAHVVASAVASGRHLAACGGAERGRATKMADHGLRGCATRTPVSFLLNRIQGGYAFVMFRIYGNLWKGELKL